MHLFSMCNRSVNSVGNLGSLLCSRFPGLVFHATINSLLRSSHVFPKAPHLEADARLLPEPCCVPAGVCLSSLREQGHVQVPERGWAALSHLHPHHCFSQ